MMKMLVCIPLEVDANTTARKEIRRAARVEILALARDPSRAAMFFRDMLNTDEFLVRAPEPKKDKDSEPKGPVTPVTLSAIEAPEGSSGVG